MNIKTNFVFHQKSKSISNKLTLKDYSFNNNSLNGQPIYEHNFSLGNKNPNNLITEDKSIEKNNTDNNNNQDEKMEEINLIKTIDEMKQNTLDLYYDKNSPFKKKIDNLNLKFYLETEKYLNNSKINDHFRNQKLQANLFVILFQQINVFIEEIERLNKIILDHKFQKATILQRTNELNEKKQNILIKDNLIQSLKKSNTNTEKKLLETLLHEDELIKDNERLRKENETYKTLTIVFEKELKNKIKKNGLTPQKSKIPRHIKTYSDYGVPSTSIINELCGHNINSNKFEENYETVNNEIKYTTREKKNSLYNVKGVHVNKELYSTNNNKNNYSLNIDKKSKNNNEIYRNMKNNKIIKKKPILTDNKNLIKFSPNNSNFRQKLKQSQDNKIKIKKDISINNNNNNNKNENNKIDSNNNNKNIVNKNNNNLCYSFVYTNNKNPIVTNKNRKLKLIKKNKNCINLESIANNINSTINTNTNTNTMTEANNNLSYEKRKDKNYKKLEPKKVCYHKKQKTMNEMTFNEIVRVQIINDEINNTTINNKVGNINSSNSNNNNSNNSNNINNKIGIKKNDGKNNVKKSPRNKNINKINNIKKNF